MLWGTLVGWRQGSVRTPEKFEDWSHYQNSVGVHSAKSALETEDLVLRAEHIDPISVVHHQGRSTCECALPLKGIHPYTCCEGNPTDKSRAPPTVARQERARKHPLHGRENLRHRGAVQPPEQQDLCSNLPWGERKRSEGEGRQSPFLRCGLMGGCLIRGWHLFIFARKGWNWCPRVSRRRATRSCETS